MFNNITLEYPAVLLIILPFIFCAYYCKAKSPTYYMPHLNILKDVNTNINFFIIFLKWFIIVFALISLSSPVKILDNKFIKNNGIDIVLCLDTSGSMRAIGFNKDDLEQNRWKAVSLIVQDFIKKRLNDNIALVVFGSSVLTASPISFDKQAQSEIISYLDIGIVGDKTALIDSLATSINILKDSKAKSKLIIILSDGEDTISTIPLKVVKFLAKKYKIKIYAIGIGESNISLLNQITQDNGKTFHARNKKDLKKVYEEINKLEKSKIETNKIILKQYLFFYSLFFTILALILFIFLKNKE